ncbi:MAG: hypothetical protein ABI871_03880 [Chthoniobacterales bacterium]
MYPELRAKFNGDFTPEKYAALLRGVNETERWPADFRISETPIFLDRDFRDEVIRAAERIVAATRTAEFRSHSASAIPRGLEVPGETPHPSFIQVDFGICDDGRGGLTPGLIELQAFPSLYCFQPLYLHSLRAAYQAIPHNWNSYFSELNESSYVDLLRRTIVGSVDPENVILLEIEPDRQKTRIDFACTETALGVRPVNLTTIKKRGARLFYGREVRIERIYNRVIFDELIRRSDLHLPFRFQDELEVTWAGHPNWYFRISKHSLPFLRTEHTPAAFFADEFPPNEPPAEYVLKPLYSFAGLGVEMEPTREKLNALKNPREWILQKKIEYAEFVPTPDGAKSKAEIRMMFVWPDDDPHPTLVNNLVRMSQGKMMGVDFNREKTWVGSSIALHER